MNCRQCNCSKADGEFVYCFACGKAVCSLCFVRTHFKQVGPITPKLYHHHEEWQKVHADARSELAGDLERFRTELGQHKKRMDEEMSRLGSAATAMLHGLAKDTEIAYGRHLSQLSQVACGAFSPNDNFNSQGQSSPGGLQPQSLQSLLQSLKSSFAASRLTPLQELLQGISNLIDFATADRKPAVALPTAVSETAPEAQQTSAAGPCPPISPAAQAPQEGLPRSQEGNPSGDTEKGPTTSSLDPGLTVPVAGSQKPPAASLAIIPVACQKCATAQLPAFLASTSDEKEAHTVHHVKLEGRVSEFSCEFYEAIARVWQECFPDEPTSSSSASESATEQTEIATSSNGRADSADEASAQNCISNTIPVRTNLCPQPALPSNSEAFPALQPPVVESTERLPSNREALPMPSLQPPFDQSTERLPSNREALPMPSLHPPSDQLTERFPSNREALPMPSLQPPSDQSTERLPRNREALPPLLLPAEQSIARLPSNREVHPLPSLQPPADQLIERSLSNREALPPLLLPTGQSIKRLPSNQEALPPPQPSANQSVERLPSNREALPPLLLPADQSMEACSSDSSPADDVAAGPSSPMDQDDPMTHDRASPSGSDDSSHYEPPIATDDADSLIIEPVASTSTSLPLNDEQSTQNGTIAGLAYASGDLVWACLTGFPYWPGIIGQFPTGGEFVRTPGSNRRKYHVFFLGDDTHNWIDCKSLLRYEGVEKLNGEFSRQLQTVNSAKQKKAVQARFTVKQRLKEDWLIAVQQADRLAELPRQDRLASLYSNSTSSSAASSPEPPAKRKNVAIKPSISRLKRRRLFSLQRPSKSYSFSHLIRLTPFCKRTVELPKVQHQGDPPTASTKPVPDKQSSPTKSAVCGICQKTFSSQSHLSVHQRLHTGEKPFDCYEPGCDESFRQKCHLNKHMVNKHPDAAKRLKLEWFKCGDCSRGFYLKNNYEHHRRIVH